MQITTMLILVQWSLGVPGDWQAMPARDWSAQAAKPLPAGGESLDQRPGWVFALNVQGVQFAGYDHYAIGVGGRPSGAAAGAGSGVEGEQTPITVTVWNDDPSDRDPGEFVAQAWTFLPLAADPALKGAINTRQSRVIYAAPDLYARCTHADLGANTTLLPWSLFQPPSESATRHGAWLYNWLAADHVRAQSRRGWREWGAHLSATERDAAGRLKPQRVQGRFERPRGTRTYYARATARANGVYSADVENAFETATGTAASASSSVTGTTDEVGFVFSSPAGEPDNAAWPTGTYRYQLDVTAASADLVYGLKTLGGSAGGFVRAQSDLAANLETKAQAEASFSGTGLKLATTGSVSWSAGSATNRFVAAVAIQNNLAQHIAQTLTLELNESDDYADGPWIVGQSILPAGIATAEAFGAAKLAGPLAPSGIASLEAFGTAHLTLQALMPDAIASAEAFGTAQLNLKIRPAGIAGAEGFGAAVIGKAILPAGIASAEGFGGTTVVTSPGKTVVNFGIAGEEAFGAARLNFRVDPTGIASAQAFGAARVNLRISPTGIPSAEAFGTTAWNYISAPGISSAGAFGLATISLVTPFNVIAFCDETFAVPGFAAESFAVPAFADEDFNPGRC